MPQEALEAAEAARTETVAAAAGPAPATAAPSGTPRTLLVLQVEGSEARPIADALSLSKYEAGQRLARGGYQLLNALEPAAAATEATRLRGHGLTVHLLPENRVR